MPVGFLRSTMYLWGDCTLTSYYNIWLHDSSRDNLSAKCFCMLSILKKVHRFAQKRLRTATSSYSNSRIFHSHEQIGN